LYDFLDNALKKLVTGICLYYVLFISINTHTVWSLCVSMALRAKIIFM
jgi:hypothetical protein